MGTNVLIIKLAAIGDVLRTTPILCAVKRQYPKSHISWLVDEEASGLLVDNPLIDRLLVFNKDTASKLEPENFDLVLSLDKDQRALALVMKMQAKEKRGFGLSPRGDICPLNKEAEYAYKLGISDELKFKKNTLTYPQQIYEACKFKYQRDEYILRLSDNDINYAHNLLDKFGVLKSKLIIGLNTGAGRRFVNKAWTISGYIELIKRLNEEIDASIIVLGGPDEKERNKAIVSEAQGLAIDIGCGHSITQFSGIINFCNLVVSGDTTALHIAIALKKRIVTIIGPTCAQEIELYNRGQRIVSQLDCVPCYKNTCDKEVNCMQSISIEEVLGAIKRQIK